MSMCVCCFVLLCVCVLLCFVDPILGNRYGPGVSSFRYWPGVAGSSPSTLTTSLAIPVPSSSSSNGPSTSRSRPRKNRVCIEPQIRGFWKGIRMGEKVVSRTTMSSRNVSAADFGSEKQRVTATPNHSLAPQDQMITLVQATHCKGVRHTYVDACVCACVHVCVCVSVRAYVRTCHTHARTQAHKHARTHARTHACSHARTHARTYALTDTHTHTCTHAHTQASTYACRTPLQWVACTNVII